MSNVYDTAKEKKDGGKTQIQIGRYVSRTGIVIWNGGGKDEDDVDTEDGRNYL